MVSSLQTDYVILATHHAVPALETRPLVLHATQVNTSKAQAVLPNAQLELMLILKLVIAYPAQINALNAQDR